MYDRLYIGPPPVDQQMHADFAGDVPPTANVPSFAIHYDHIARPHRAFAQASWRHQNAIIRQTNREIAIHRRDKATFMEHATVSDDFFPVFALCGQDNPSGEEQRKSGLH